MTCTFIAIVNFLLLSTASAADTPPFILGSYTYKTVGDLKLQAHLRFPGGTQPRPVIVWIHGGALIMGDKYGVPQDLDDLCTAKSYARVSIDYRLAPEVKLPEIVADVEDAIAWIRKEGNRYNIDPNRMVITGGSAGGYLALTMGSRLKDKPKALVAYWGYGDVDGDWLSKPSEHYRKASPLVEQAEAFKAISKTPLTGREGFDSKARSRLYLYFRQNGLWTKEVTGFDPTEKTKLDPYCPVRNVTKDYPPTLLVHGTEDTDVPYERSAEMAKEFEKHKVPFEFITVKGAGHGLSGGDKKLVTEAHDKAVAYIREKLK
jgi:acetyl esterase/lipase